MYHFNAYEYRMNKTHGALGIFCGVKVQCAKQSWKFVGQAEAKVPKPLDFTDYFGTPKNVKTCISNVISNTFQNHNLIRRNIEAVTTRRSWKPFAQKARGFESLFLRHLCSTKKLQQTRKHKLPAYLVLFCYYILCFVIGQNLWI